MSAFTDLVDVASERLGGTVLLANDEFFAPAENLLKPAKPVWKEGDYTDRGKWMDGWESRRRRTPGHDWCLIRLGCRAVVRGVVVDTAFFRGNHPEACSIDACAVEHDTDPARLAEAGPEVWHEILPRAPLEADQQNSFPITAALSFTHLRLNIHPDGGVARLRVYGEPARDPRLVPGVPADLAALTNGGLVIACSDMSFGNRHHLNLPGHSTHMGDGWETRRRRGPGNDWSILRLAARGAIDTIEIDTDHFKGNAPESAIVDVCDIRDASPERLTGGAVEWVTILPRTPLEPDSRHLYSATRIVPATHARLSIFPDGGIARLRLLGKVVG